MKRTWVALGAVAVVLRGAPAIALEPATSSGSAAPSNIDQAREHFRRGAELFKEGSFDAALVEFTRAYQIAPNYRVLYNIAQVQMERHDYAAAQSAFSDYLSQGDAEISPDRRSEVEDELKTLRGRVAELTVTSNVAGAELSIDGVVVGKLPLQKPLLVSSGVRHLSLQSAGFVRRDRTVSVAGGEKPTLEMLLDPLPVAKPTAAPNRERAERREESSSHTGVWLGVATTAVLAGGAVTFGLLAQHNNDRLDKELSRYPGDAARIDSARDRVKLFAGLTDGTAGASLVAGLITIYAALSSSRSASEPTKAAVHSGLTARIAPSWDRLTVQGEF
jgi:hypothetical protein